MRIATEIIGLPTSKIWILRPPQTASSFQITQPAPPVHHFFKLTPSGQRYRTWPYKKVSFSCSFVPSAIAASNQLSCWWNGRNGFCRDVAFEVCTFLLFHFVSYLVVLCYIYYYLFYLLISLLLSLPLSLFICTMCEMYKGVDKKLRQTHISTFEQKTMEALTFFLFKLFVI